MNFLRQAFVTFALIACLSGTGWAQTVELRGRVLDPRGGALAGASVELLQGNQRVAETYTDLEGEFRLAVPPGEYRIEMAAPNFAQHSETVRVRPGMAPLSVTLELAALEQALEVQEAIETVSPEPDRNLSATVLTAEDLLDLPEEPGELAAVLQELAGDSPDGASEMIVDGFAGGRLPSRDQIQEIRINRNPFSSEYSRPGRGRIEVVTRAGTGELHGNLSFNFRDDALNARQALADTKPPYQQRSFRANLGGPILRNRLSGTLSAARSDEQESDSIHAVTPEGLLSSGIVRPTNRTNLDGRIQYRLGERQTLNLGGEWSSRRRENQGVGETTLPERAFDSKSSDYSLQIRETAVLSSSTINEIRFQFERENLKNVPLTNAAAINVLDAFQAGGAQNRSQEARREYEGSDTLTLTRGPATFRTGVQFWYRSFDTLSEQNFLGTFVFSSLDAYRAGLPTTFTLQRGDPALDLNQLELGAFFQSDLRLTQRLMLSLGVRYEGQTNIGDRNNFDPRVGIAYTLNQTTAIRGGVGLFHQRLNSGTVLSLRRLDGTRQSQLVIRNPSYPDAFAGGVAGEVVLPASVRAQAEDLAAPYSVNSSLSLEKRLPRGVSLALSYDFVRGIHLYRSRNSNAPLPGVFERPEPTRGNIELLESTALSNYHSLNIHVMQRMGPTMVVFNYTLSSQENDAEGPFSLPADNYDLRAEWGRAGQDQRHAVSTLVNLSLPWGLSASTRWQANSGRPYDITTGLDDNGDTIFRDRPSGVARNSGNGPGLFNISLNLSKTISLTRRNGGPAARRGNRGAAGPNFFQQGGGPGGPRGPGGIGGPGFGGGGGGGGGRGGQRGGGPELTIFADIRNLLNHTNFTRFSGVLSSPLYGRPLSARSPREIGLGLRFNF